MRVFQGIISIDPCQLKDIEGKRFFEHRKYEYGL